MDSITQGQTLQTGVPQIYRKSVAEAKEIDRSTGHPLDAPEYQELLKKLMQWRRQARVAQADNRMEMAIDEDFYDGIQLEPEDLHILMQRNQPPLVFNVIKNTINWILGTERKSRIDSRVLPRKKSGVPSAKAKTKLMKYVQDQSKGEFEWSQAFTESIKAGIGWMEDAVRDNGEEPLFMRQERWRNMWYDHLGLSMDGSDWRFVIREKWTDLDYAQALFPERMSSLKVLAEGVNSLYPYLPDDVVVTDNASEFDLESDLDSLFGGPFDGIRERVKLVECWYRVPAYVKIMKAMDTDNPFGTLDGTIFRGDNADHQYLVKGKYFSLNDAYMMTTRCAIWAGATMLQDMLTPYNHNKFPFTPLICYRRQRDNMVYGAIRDLRDPQSDLNRRKSKALVLLTANRMIYETGSINNPNEAYEEFNRPDTMLEVNRGTLTEKKIQILQDKELAAQHVDMARDDERFINDISGVTPEQKGQSKRDLSGVAISKLQIQGETTSGVFFDNYYYARQNEGEIRLSLIEQFIDQEKEYRITGDRQKDEFIKVNERKKDGKIINNISEQKSDYIIGKQDYRESLRLAMFSMLSELVQNLAASMPEVALALLDEVIDYMDDLPNKEEIVARIRKINKQHAPEEDLTDEEKAQLKQDQEKQQQMGEMMEQLNIAMAQAQLAIKQAEGHNKESQALKNTVAAQAKKIEGFIKALEAAGTINILPQIVGAADTIIEEAEKVGGNNSQPGQRQMTDRTE